MMRTSLKVFGAVLVLLCLAACSTTPVTKASASPVPPDRIYAPSMFQPQSNATAKVSFLRDSGFVGSVCRDTIYVNGKRAFRIGPSEYAVIYLAPGNYLFQLKSGKGICPNYDLSQATTLTAHSSQVFRILIPAGGDLHFTRTK